MTFLEGTREYGMSEVEKSPKPDPAASTPSESMAGEKNRLEKGVMPLQRHPYLVNRSFREYLLATVLASASIALGVTVDGIIVGNLLGVDALAAVNLAAPVLQLFMAVTLLLNAGGATLAAHALGRQDRNDARSLFTLSLTLSLVCAGMLMLLGAMFSGAIAGLLCPNPTLRPLVLTYVRIVLLSAPVYLGLHGLCFYIRIDGAPKRASWALVIANVANLSCDLLFIKVFGWGIAGSALATTCGFSLGLGIALAHFIRPGTTLLPARPDWRRLPELLFAGLPVAAAAALLAVQLFGMNQIVVQVLGPAGMGVMAVCYNLLMPASMVVGGISQTLQPIGGILYGAKDYRGLRIAVGTAFKVMLWWLLGLMLLFLLIPGECAVLFGVSATPEVKSAIRSFWLCLPLGGVNYLLMVVYQITGRRRAAVAIAWLDTLLILPVMFAISRYSAPGIWLSFVITEIAVLLLVAGFAWKIRRREPGLTALTLLPPDASDSLNFSIRSAKVDFPAMMTEIHSFLGKYELSGRIVAAVQLCCEELVVNILEHAYVTDENHRFVDIDLRKMPDRIVLSIRDDGHPFDPVACGPEGGLGLRLVRGFSSSIHYARLAGQNFVTVTCDL
jgi:Na+-driven multidrug efflux pump/anti-sigma regulatory factor (Ser/Thr protein kinase)